jgi:aminoglycoside phosphotransferase (APT) family kinase protein
MSVVTSSNIMLYPAQAVAAHEHALELASTAGLQVTDGETLRFVPDMRIIVRATLEGRDVVLRAPLSEAGQEPMAKEWAELKRTHAYMSEGPNQVVEPIYFDEETGLTVIAFVPGRPLMSHLSRLPRETRAQTYALAGTWLEAYLAPTLTMQPANTRRWLRRAKEAMATQPHEKLREVEQRVFRKMRHLSEQIGTEPWPVAITHSDFHPNNLILTEQGLTGIDCGGSGRAPVAKDLARSLTHMARRGILFGKERHFGVDAAAFHALQSHMDFAPEMWTRHLPFMLCFETLIRVEHPEMPADRVDHAFNMTRGLLRGLRKIT